MNEGRFVLGTFCSERMRVLYRSRQSDRLHVMLVLVHIDITPPHSLVTVASRHIVRNSQFFGEYNLKLHLTVKIIQIKILLRLSREQDEAPTETEVLGPVDPCLKTPLFVDRFSPAPSWDMTSTPEPNLVEALDVVYCLNSQSRGIVGKADHQYLFSPLVGVWRKTHFYGWHRCDHVSPLQCQ
ncbi:hypothetical protein TNCV_1251061 [Trichonephila clavipes]|nr:hypothetical protein TNCV_1251061 [Trichonephila clavipes]